MCAGLVAAYEYGWWKPFRASTEAQASWNSSPAGRSRAWTAVSSVPEFQRMVTVMPFDSRWSNSVSVAVIVVSLSSGLRWRRRYEPAAAVFFRCGDWSCVNRVT